MCREGMWNVVRTVGFSLGLVPDFGNTDVFAGGKRSGEKESG